MFNSKSCLLRILFASIGLTIIGMVPGNAQTGKIDSLTQLLKTHTQKDQKRAQILLNLGSENMRLSPKLALPYAEEVLSFQDNMKDKTYISNAHRMKGISQFYLSMYPEALESLNKALSIDNAVNNAVGTAADLSNIGLVYMTQSKFAEALKYYLEALQKHEVLKNELNVAITLTNIGTVHNEMSDYKVAMQNYQRALPIFRKYKHAVGQSSTLTNIGTIHFKNNNIDEAIKYSKMSLAITDSIGDTRGSARENGNLSAYYSKLRQSDLALKYGFKAIEGNEKLSNTKSLGFNMQNISDAFYQQQDYAKAKTYGLNALKIARDLDVAEIKRDASLGLSEIYNALKAPDSTLFYYKLFKEYGDSISNDKKKNEITRMGMKYEFDKTEAIYKQKQVLAEGQLKQNQLQLALNNAELQRGLQLRNLQNALLENEKLVRREKERQLLISKNNEKLQSSKLNALSQEQKLNQLEIRQLWLYGILAIITLASVLIYILNLNRIRRLRFANILQRQEAEQSTLKLEYQYQLSESELRAIRSQMNPHFIFNVLNSIESYIMDNDKRTASRLIQKFASLSRLILENSTKSLVPADKEWKSLQLYTELEAMRYNNSFTYSFVLSADISLPTILLPPMLIQPLIENSILHGIIGAGIPDAYIAVAMQRSDQTLLITVTDNGIGLHGKTNRTVINVNKEKSIGLKSIKERIDLINTQYPGSASFSIEQRTDQQGTIAHISLPLLSQ
ncbi:tetratricopeptide repeat-containing sensor histidine kinase [Dyadobacter chenhuakuii]|uniref:Tetratricopeptide repeat protein n=1 Tax=Dyadobacter chenhuakuii TaxID=2909339 RepID=A0ABY4XRN4_9BACT|nr:tetratricopeptide repeat protein [Dyadobacter chenhuakuii]MCF2492920.1 tetratricopeptide repeat protein [Dyadobacter chenhuakuii]USJ32790.1 tetratricopeptide repeat protein [Dyadobacter chenhuakuii]